LSVLAVLIALLLEQARPLPPLTSLRGGYQQWAAFIGRNFDAGLGRHAVVVWMLTVALPVIGVAAIHMVVASFSLLLAFAIDVAVLYLTLGFRQFSHYFTGIREALDQGDEPRSRQLLAQWQQVDASELPRTELLRQVIEYAVLASHRHVFGVMFWFVLLATLGFGPAGAVLYRLSQVALQHWARRHPIDGEPVSPNVLELAQRLWTSIDYVPARLSAFGFAIVGNFEEAVASWRRDASMWSHPNDGAVLAAAAGAVGVQLGASAHRSGPAATVASAGDAGSPAGHGGVSLVVADQNLNPPGLTAGAPPQMGHLQSVIGLVWRSVVLWLLLLALLSVANLLG
jgi:adenosylcobinamide-phosphate synthase